MFPVTDRQTNTLDLKTTAKISDNRAARVLIAKFRDSGQ